MRSYLNQNDLSPIHCTSRPWNNSGKGLSTGQRQSRKIGEMEPFALTFPLAFRETCRAGRINFSRDQIRATRVETRGSLGSFVPESGPARNKNGICFRLCNATRECISSRCRVSTRCSITLVIIRAAFTASPSTLQLSSSRR